jgi:asparagine synthase (glutamine-hydrolysing)
MDILTHDTAHDGGDINSAYRALVGVEARDPTADRRVVEFCFGVPDRQYLHRGRSRWLVRRAMAGRLPAEVLDKEELGQQAVDWLTRSARERERLLADLDRFAEDRFLSGALDLPRLRNAVVNWPAEPVGARSELGGVVPRGIAAGRFARWAAGRNQ